MNSQPKTPGAMVLVPRDKLEAIEDLLACPQHHVRKDYIEAYTYLEALLLAPAEQTPAAVGSIAERIRAATIVDSGQEGVNIAEGRFGRAMAALCLQLDGGTPAVGGEPETALIQIRIIDRPTPSEWLDAEPEGLYRARRNISVHHELGGKLQYEIRELIDRAHIAPLLARIAELEARIAKANDWSHLKPDMDPPKR